MTPSTASSPASPFWVCGHRPACWSALARGPALAVGLGLVWVLVVENLLRGVATVFAPIRPATDHLPGTAAGSLAGSMRTVDGPATPGVLDTLSRGESFAVLGVYLAIFATAPAIRAALHEGIDDADYVTTLKVLQQLIRNSGGTAA